MSSGFWEEERDEAPPAVLDDVVDVAFALAASSLAADHAWALAQALREPLPWFDGEPLAGLHLVHTAASGNGWTSPEDVPGGVLYLSRRTRLVLRLPQARVAAARQLSGHALRVAGSELQVGAAKVQLLSPLTTLYCRHLVTTDTADEAAFLGSVSEGLAALGIRCRRMVSGRPGRFRFPDGAIATRSLLLADLDFADSQLLQRHGLGRGRHTGFGLFVPHKTVGSR
ncbi:MAG TPA: type I-MYXAN CRISPR-associated protein Cas6/Cmx6 [Gammaproteobacteria bacterium]